jgi:methyltransferase-like protein/trans-aconitate methyltransferase
MAADRLDAETSYDLVPYESRPYPQAHPDRLATVATLFGASPASPERCRVLELGCASGGNLVPMAVELPASTFLGLDASARQVDDGRRTIEAVGLANVELRHADILETQDLGLFDYVICHGVFSWVPPPVRERILDICAQNLAPEGVAYVSYNAYPGWHFRGMVREMMRYHAARFEDPATRVRQAAALLDFLASSVTAKDGPYGQLLSEELELLRRVSGSYLFHEHLEDTNEPLYFHRFVERAASRGLQYLGEAEVASMAAYRVPKEVLETLRRISSDQIQAEQYLDFLRNRTFRQTLLCHDRVPLDRSIEPGRLAGMHVAAPVRSVPKRTGGHRDDEAVFRGRRSEEVSTRDPLLKAALELLAAAWPATVPYSELVERSGDVVAPSSPTDGSALGEQLLRLHLSGGPVELHVVAPMFVREVSDRPRASPLARYQAVQSDVVTNLRHERVQLSDVERFTIRLLDGSLDGAAVAAALGDAIRRGALVPSRAGDEVRSDLDAAEIGERVAHAALRRAAASALLAS